MALRKLGVGCGALIILASSSIAETAPAATTAIVPPSRLASNAPSGQSSTVPAAHSKIVGIAVPAANVMAGAGFNREVASKALKAAADAAKTCKQPDGPTGTGKVQVTFAPSGRVSDALLISGPFAGTVVGKCVIRLFRAAEVPPFDGSPMTVAKSFSVH
jgi:hypothetical protein